MSLRVKVLYFASAREATGIEQEWVEVAGTTLAALREQLVTTHGEKLARVLQSSVYAVDMEYVQISEEAETILKEGNEVAVIPPVSGGDIK